MDSPEERARANIDRLLSASDWEVQDRSRANLGAAAGVAVRESPLTTGEADYLLFANRKVIGAVEAKPDRVTEAAFSPEATERARATVESFRQFIETHRDEITALQMIYGRPYAQRRLTYEQVKELAGRLAQAQPNWTTESLCWAYAQLEKDKVSGAAAQRVLTDLVSLVRHAVQLDDELVPYPRVVEQRYESWLAEQETAGRKFTGTQCWWLDGIAEHIGVNLAMTEDDFDIGEFFDRGGQMAARKQFGRALPALLDELNAELVR